MMRQADPVQLEARRTIPLVVLRVAGVVLAAASFMLIPLPYAIVAVCLALVGALLPASLMTWGAIVVMTLSLLAHPLALDGRAHALLLAVHLLHVLGGLALALPALGRLQLRALVGPGRRWLLLQLTAQALLLLAELAATHLPRLVPGPAGAVVIASALCVIAMVILARVLTSRR